MKFSEAKKAKMRRRRQKNIAEETRYVIGRCIERWEYDETIEKGEFVVVQNISGNKLIVKKREIKEKN